MVLTTAFLASCNSVAEVPPTSKTALPGIVEEAQAAGASEEQLAVLTEGDVSFADYERALHTTFECMRSHGLEVLEEPPSDRGGVMLISYSWGPGSVAEAQAKELGDGCLNEHSLFVEQVYQTQPSTIEAVEAAYESKRSKIVACIRDNGGTIDEDADRQTAQTASWAVLDASGVDCFATAGLS